MSSPPRSPAPAPCPAWRSMPTPSTPSSEATPCARCRHSCRACSRSPRRSPDRCWPYGCGPFERSPSRRSCSPPASRSRTSCSRGPTCGSAPSPSRLAWCSATARRSSRTSCASSARSSGSRDSSRPTCCARWCAIATDGSSALAAGSSRFSSRTSAASRPSRSVFSHRGTVDKYMGDGIMALYNAPREDSEHALNAIRTALEFQERVIPFSARWEAKLGVPIRCGVGINSGEAVVGSLGSKQRNEYTAIGDPVNLAARLESVTKDYRVPIIISEYTYELVRGRFPTHELDTVTVKGKSQPVKIYGVVPSSMRAHPRALLDAAVQLTATDGRVCRARTFDISEGGLGLVGVPDEWPVGSKIAIRLDGSEVARRIVAQGTIVSRRGEKAGVQFASLDAEIATAVAEYVAQIGRAHV